MQLYLPIFPLGFKCVLLVVCNFQTCCRSRLFLVDTRGTFFPHGGGYLVVVFNVFSA